MVNAKECDRCGEIYGAKESRFLGSQGMTDRDGKKIDLCFSCEEDLENFYNYEFEKIEEVKKLLKKKEAQKPKK